MRSCLRDNTVAQSAKKENFAKCMEAQTVSDEPMSPHQSGAGGTCTAVKACSSQPTEVW